MVPELLLILLAAILWVLIKLWLWSIGLKVVRLLGQAWRGEDDRL